jgi:hypothetical protein
MSTRGPMGTLYYRDKQPVLFDCCKLATSRVSQLQNPSTANPCRVSTTLNLVLELKAGARWAGLFILPDLDFVDNAML